MSLLMSIVVYLLVGCAEWYLALRRTLACARGEKVLLVSIVFIENLLGLWVLSNFVRTNNWSLALSYSGGASAGALLVAAKTQKAEKQQEAQRSARCSTTDVHMRHERALRWLSHPPSPLRPKRAPSPERERAPA